MFLILKLLDRIRYRTKFGLSIGDLLKIWYHDKFNQKRCLCGGYIISYSNNYDGWEESCDKCGMVYSED